MTNYLSGMPFEYVPPLDEDYHSPEAKKIYNMRVRLMMEWMKFGDTDPPADTEVLVWHKKRGCLIGSVSYDISGEVMFVHEKSSGTPSMEVRDYTYWCEIPKPTPEDK